MNVNPQQELRDLKPEKEFFIGIDSDGCVFDTMEIKQKECFCPNVIKYYELQTISKFARETWEFVNLYSKTRGCNRFLAVEKLFELLAKRKDVLKRNPKLPDITPLKDWIRKETKLGNPTLEKYAQQMNDPMIDLTYKWSINVNEDIEKMVYGIAPFPFVNESLEKMAPFTDILVVSQTPVEALSREWKENGIDNFPRIIAGQEYGTKTEHIALAAKNKYPSNKILMIGDAPGDQKAAKSNGVLFYPINPGHEDASWERFFNEALDRFFKSTYEGDYEKTLIAEFEAYLPEHPHWDQI
ncbi:MAG: HAD hydrolase-like protein [Bacteroidales bacterium]|nr:HAD hydrolase-like protein [Bacteroidales bacterium]